MYVDEDGILQGPADLGDPPAAPSTSTSTPQRAERVEFSFVPNTTTEDRQQTLVANPVSVEFGSGAAEILSGIAGETTFIIEQAGIYMMEWRAVITSADRGEPCLEVRRDSDDVVLGVTEAPYIRYAAQGDYNVRLTGLLTVAAAGTVVKAIVRNCRDDSTFAVTSGHGLHLNRL